MGTGCCPGQKCNCPPGPAGPSSADVVFAQSDLPTPQGGVITLAADTTYWIAEEVTIADGVAIQMSAGSCLIGNAKYCSRLVGNVAAGAFIRGLSGSDLNIQNLTIENTGGQTVSANGAGTADVHLINVVLDGTTIGLGVTDADEVDIHNVDFLSGTIGLSLSGTINEVAVDDSLFSGTGGIVVGTNAVVGRLKVNSNRFNGTTNSISLIGTTVDELPIVGNAFDVAVGGSALGIGATMTLDFLLFVGNDVMVPAGADGIVLAGAVSAASVSGSAFHGTGTFQNGVTSCTVGWEWDNNIGVQNTLYGGLLRATASPAVVVGPVSAAAIVPALDTGSCKFALGAGADANKLEYTGVKSIRARIEAILSGTTAAPGNVDAQILVNGAPVGGAVTVQFDTVNRLLSVSTMVVLSPSDVIDVNITTTNLTALTDYQLSAAA